MSKEIIIPHDEIRDPQQITEVMTNKFKENGLNIHQHEVVNGVVEDDFKKGIRKISVQNTKYFFMPVAPWKR